MIEEDVIKIFEMVNPQVLHIAGNQDGEHPNTVFCIVELIDSNDLGEPFKSLRSSDGSWTHNQPREFILSVGFQGRFDSNAAELANILKIYLDNDVDLKSEFKRNGFSYYTGSSVSPIPMKKGTSQYIRYAFQLNLKTNIATKIGKKAIEKVEINKGVFKDLSGGKFYEYKGDVGNVK